jgi:hypothetical protein
MTTTPDKEVEIQEVNAKNSKLEAIEFLREMAGYPNSEYASIAKRMNIPQSTARDYLKRYIWGVLHTLHDTDYPRRLMEIYNHDTVAVPPNKALTHKDINHLNPIVNRYAKFSYADTGHPEKPKEQQQVQEVRRPAQKPRTITRPAIEDEEYEEEEEEEDEDELSSKKLMGDIAGSRNAQYLYIILRDIPGIGNPKIRKYLRFFAKNEADYMANPERFKNELKITFGDGPGTLVYNSFVYGMSTFGRPGQGVGFNPYTGQQYSGSTGTPQDWIKNNPNLETYYRMNIIPYGVPPDSPIAIESVNRFHEKQRRKEAMEEEDMNFNRWLKAKTAKTMDENMGGQQQGGMNGMMPMMVASGMMAIEQGIDETGKAFTRYVPRKKESGGLFGEGDGNSKEMGLLQTIISGKDQLINTLISKSMEQPKMMESLLGRFIQNMDPDPTAQLARMKQFAETLYPQNQSLQNNMEAMRLRLEEIRLTKDMNMADAEAKRQFDKERWDKERQERMEAEAAKNTQHIMDGILGLGKEMLGPALAIFGGKGLAGMIPGMGGQGGMGMGGGIPGMGMPPNPFAPQAQQPMQNPFVQSQQPQQQQASRMSPETFAYMKQVEDAKRQAGMQSQTGPPQAGPFPGARPQQGFRAFVEAPRRPPTMMMNRGQDVIEEYSEGPSTPQPQPQVRNYNPDQFENATPEVLSAAEKEALRRKAELDNYINNLRIAKRKKTNVFRTKRPAPQNVMEEEIAVAPTIGGGIDTTVSPSADVAVTHPRSEVGSVEIPEMIPEKAQRDDVEVPGEPEAEEEEEDEEDKEFEEDEEEDEEEEEYEAGEGEEREGVEDNIEEAK